MTTRRRFPYVTERGGHTPGSLVVDPGSLSPARRARRAGRAGCARACFQCRAGWPQAVGHGHPLAVMGPQLGFYYPELFLEVDAHGGGVHARGGTLPGLPYVLIGRGRDYAWSATSASQ